MSVSGISSSSLFDYNTQSVQNKMQQFQKEFQQLGQDLQSGNMSAAQSDFATLQQYAPQTSSTSSSQSNSPIAQEFSQLAKDIQSGNTSAAQQDYSTIQQDMQSHAAEGHHHHHSSGGGGEGQSAISQLMSQLGQALQSGNLSSAQQAYSTLQQEFQQFTQNSSVTTPSSSNNVSLSA
jgi:outer membrane protein assembly factor BamD (BamD/ComL family)